MQLRLHIGLCEDLSVNVWERKEMSLNGNSGQEGQEETQLFTLTPTHLALPHGLCEGQRSNVNRESEAAARARVARG